MRERRPSQSGNKICLPVQAHPSYRCIVERIASPKKN